MEIGPNDMPAPCATCGTTQLHRPGVNGQLVCLACMARAFGQPVAQPQQAPQINVRVGPTIGEQMARGVVIAILFIIILVVWARACGGGG